MAEKGPSKKRKIEADVVDSSSESSRFWFEDGNIIITAQGTSFKVHRGVLSRHSEVFRDMFLIPQPESTETAPAYPVVDLSDTKEEVEYMLSALYDGLRYAVRSVRIGPVLTYLT